MENLSALFETFLLLLTCAWIIREAVARLVLNAVQVRVNLWGNRERRFPGPGPRAPGTVQPFGLPSGKAKATDWKV